MASTGYRAGGGRFLPRDPRVEEPFRLTPQLAFRLALLGAVALGVFGVLFFRLWALQVLSGPQYLRAALDNQVRTAPVEAPRGPILDVNGRTIVANKAGIAVRIWPADLPRTWHGRLSELERLSAVVNVPVSEIVAKVKKRGNDPITPVTVKESVPRDQMSYLSEHEAQFPGVTLTRSFLRNYQYGSLAAQVLGYVGEISPSQLTRLRRKGYRITDRVGQAGIESTYDSYLRGRDGLAQLRVDSLGRPRSALTIRQPYSPGQALRLTLDVNLQRAAEQGIKDGLAAAHASACVGCWAARGGAIVALDPRDGSVLALASAPSFNPALFEGHASARELAPLINPIAARDANFPGLNRAIGGLYPPGSTFKPVTALAALQEQLISPFGSLLCKGSLKIKGQVFNNWDPSLGAVQMTMRTALGASCDTFFYQLGYGFYKLPQERGHPLQAWAGRFGLGKRSGIDLAGEEAGLMPTPEWRLRTFTKKTDPKKWQIDSLWKPGDSIQLAIGQKDLLTTPLQMARFYALIANGGRLVQPHLAADVEEPGDKRAPGRTLKSFSPPPAPRISLDPAGLQVVRDGLFQGTHASFGTSVGTFGNFPYQVAGKTGTAEKAVTIPGFVGTMLQSQWCGYAPANAPTIVVCALIENGGHGSTAAAPAALRVFEQYFGVKAARATTGHGD